MKGIEQIYLFEECLKNELLQFAFMFVGYHIVRYIFNSEFGFESLPTHTIMVMCMAWILTGSFINYFKKTSETIQES